MTPKITAKARNIFLIPSKHKARNTNTRAIMSPSAHGGSQEGRPRLEEAEDAAPLTACWASHTFAFVVKLLKRSNTSICILNPLGRFCGAIQGERNEQKYRECDYSN